MLLLYERAGEEGGYVLVEAAAIDAHDDPGVREQGVGLLEGADVFVSVRVRMEDLGCLVAAWEHTLSLPWRWRT